MKPFLRLLSITASILATSQALGQSAPEERARDKSAITNYTLGPGDQISVGALELDEVSKTSYRVDSSGFVNIPLAGRIQAAGLAVSQLESAIESKLKTYQLRPAVSVSILEFRSQPISVIGAVNAPGVHHLEGKKTLVEALSLAGGLRADAGSTVKLTRQLAYGRIPLKSATDDSTGAFSVAEVKVKTILDASDPAENIYVAPNDVISVPRAEMIYVVGEVQRSGGFTLAEDQSMSVLQAISLAGGLKNTASPKTAVILRSVPGSAQRQEEPLNLKRTLDGRGEDTPLHRDDILFVPTNKPKVVAIRTIEAVVSAGTGIAIWRASR
ncbi:MAG: polysaccharide export protein [Candidatus Solibacter sp.]|nr:polysaccharide export protein [Candidatus Solibacter sp.]